MTPFAPTRLIPLVACALAPAAPALAEEVWLKGDLHAHSLHSDGDSPVADIVAAAELLGLDFFALTDHDSSMGGEPRHWDDPGYTSDTLTLLYGVEWTTGEGHGNVWAARPFDYRPLWQANLEGDPRLAADAAHAQAALFSINHPTNFLCCPWEGPGDVGDAVEVWNGAHRAPTVDFAATRRFWGDALVNGRRPTAVGGSDMHDLVFPLGIFYTVGDPTTWVLSAGTSAEEILAGIEAGRVSVSYDPEAPRVELWADGDGDGRFEAVMGGDVGAGPVTLRVILGASDEARAQGATAVEIPAARRVFEGDAGPAAFASLSRDLEEAACGPGFVVGLFEGDRLQRMARMDCGGGTWDLDLRVTPGQAWRAEVLGLPRVDPIQHPLFGLYVALSNPIYVE